MNDKASRKENNEFGIPSLVNSIIDWSVPHELQEVIKGDLSECFCNKLNSSKLRSYFWLHKQAILIFWHFSPNTQRGSFMFIFSFLVIWGIILMTFWLGGSLSMFFNLPSLIIVLVPALLAPFIVLNKNNVFGAFKALVDSNSTINDLDNYRHVFEIVGKVSMLMGWFGVISGTISIGSNIEPETFSDVFGPAFAVMSLTLLYALIVKVFCYFAVLRINSFNLSSPA